MSVLNSRRPGYRSVAVAVVLVSAAGLTGCNDSGKSSSSPSTPSPGSHVSAAELASQITHAEQQAKYFHVQQKFADTGSQARTPVDVDVELLAGGKRNINLNAGQTGMRGIGGDYYMYAANTSGTPGDKPWMSVLASDTSTIAKQTREGILIGGTGFATSDPQQTWSKGTATFVGKDGTGLHYKIVVPADYAMQTFMQGTATQDSLTELKGKSVTYDAWLNDKDVPVKVVLNTQVFASLDSSQGTGLDQSSGASSQVMTLTYSKWGQPFTVAKPPADQTATVDQVLGQYNKG